MIEVGEYVRTDNGYIAKVVENKDELILDKEIAYHGIYRSYLEEDEKEQVKHSKNLIDLIEPGDYVNGKEILEVRQKIENGLRYLMYSYVPIKYYVERTDEIKSIVTHEQFEQIKYKVKEN